MVCLIKPQFEAGKEKVGKKGVVREPAVHKEVIESVMDFAVSIGFEIKNLEFSPIRGPEGNIEYLLYARKNAREAEAVRKDALQSILLCVTEIVDNAHGDLDK